MYGTCNAIYENENFKTTLFPISKLCHATDNWHDTYLWYIGSPPVVTQKNRGNKRHIRVSEFETLQLHCIGWSGGSTLDVNLLTCSVGLNCSSPGHPEQQFHLWCVSAVNSMQQQNNTNVPVIYNAVMAVLKEEAVWPSKCQSFLLPWHTAIIRSLCSEDFKKGRHLHGQLLPHMSKALFSTAQN